MRAEPPPGGEVWTHLARLHADAFAGAARGWSEAELRALAASPGVLLLLDDATDPTGFALARVVADEAELLTLAVRPDARRRGVGGRLLAETEVAARREGATRLFLEAAAGNAPALALYRREGYAEIGRRRAYYGPSPTGDALLLSKSL